MKNGPNLTGRLICVAGLIIYLLVQGALMNLPLANWSLLPELDDSLTYALKTRQMQECWFQPCPALDDLRQQLPLRKEGFRRRRTSTKPGFFADLSRLSSPLFPDFIGPG